MEILQVALLVLLAVLVVGGSGIAVAVARPREPDVDEWIAEGVISREQAAELHRRRERELDDARRDRAAKVLGVLGGATFGVGTVLFFAANWGDIPRFARVVILLAGLMALYSAGFVLLERSRAYRNLGHAFVFVGAILFGVAIFLVGQMYNVQAHDPLAFLLWAAGALATTVFFRSQATAGLFLLAVEAWLIHELVDRGGWDGARYAPFVLLLYGLALYAAGTVGREWLDRLALTGAMRVEGFALAGFMIFVLSFPYLHLSGDGTFEDVKGLARTIVLVTGAAAVAAGALLAARAEDVLRRAEGLFVGAAAVVTVLSVLDPQETTSGFFSQEADRYPLLFCLLLVVLVGGAVVVGSLAEELWLVSSAIVLGGLGLFFGHFVDPSWDMLPRAVATLAAGIAAVLVAAAVDRRRRPPPFRVEEAETA